MVDPSQSSGPNWAQILLTGVSAAIDSQVSQPYYLANPVYNTAGGFGGQAQPTYGTGGTAASSSISPVVLLIGAVVLAALVLVLKK